MVPTASTTVALALGDALAIALLDEKEFSLKDFALFHPGGAIGKRLLLRVQDIMHSGDEMPRVYKDTPMQEAILEMTGKKLGCTLVMDEDESCLGIITDGDLRRQLQAKGVELIKLPASDCMTPKPKNITASVWLWKRSLSWKSTASLFCPVLCEKGKAQGILHMHDLIRAGVV